MNRLNVCIILVAGVNTTNNGTTFAEQQRLQEEAEEAKASTGTEYLIPSKLVMISLPSSESNETVPFPAQPRFAMYDILDRWVKNLGTKLAPWVMTASIVEGTGDPNARLMGNATATFCNGTANFTDLAISHNGTGYQILYKVTYPVNVSFIVTHGPYAIKERELTHTFSSSLPTDIYAGVDIVGLPSVVIHDKALRTQVETGWKNRTWLMRAEIIHSSNLNATIIGQHIGSIVNGTGSLTNMSVSTPGNDYQLKAVVYTEPASRYTAEYTTPKFNVSKSSFVLFIARDIGSCNETVICGHQPIIHVQNVISNLPAGNIGYDGSKWKLNVSLCSTDNANPLLGQKLVDIPQSGEVLFTDLHFDYEAGNRTLCFKVIIDPYDADYSLLSATSSPFEVKLRQMYLDVVMKPDKANETKVFGQQPVIDIKDAGTQKSAYPLRTSWNVTVSLNKTLNGAVMSGNKTAEVVGSYANFTDLAISSYGVGFILKFESNYGHEVIDCFSYSLRLCEWIFSF